ncbi:hypothetical protein ACUNV4_21530 [Granulosicoccus sp. 3-233]|uniref:hypothetical protein n=1 Tax=Granulosicoccus sp. 3-233 TaxID=3417969 RepID=UPI003D344208
MKKIAEYARVLYEAHGNKAEVEAAQKAKRYDEEGNSEEAETWRAVRKAINEMRGSYES